MWAIWDKKKKGWVLTMSLTENRRRNLIEVYTTKASAMREMAWWTDGNDDDCELRRVRITEE